MASQYYGSNYFTYGGLKMNVADNSVRIRMGFLRKVYGILSVQLLFTTLVGIAFMTIEPLKYYFANYWVILLLGGLSLFLVGMLEAFRREFPFNLYVLAAFTLCESLLIGVTVSFYEVGSVIQTFGLTCAVTIALSLYACQTLQDYSSWGASLFSALWVLILVACLQFSSFASPLLSTVVSAVGGILFSLFIIYDTQAIMQKYSPEEYIHACVNLYLDIINIFLSILKFFGKRNQD